MSWLLSLIPSRLKTWLAVSGAFAIAVGIAFLKGRASGRASYEAKRAKQRQAAIQKSQEIENDVESLSDSELDERLSRWVSDDKR